MVQLYIQSPFHLNKSAQKYWNISKLGYIIISSQQIWEQGQFGKFFAYSVVFFVQ